MPTQKINSYYYPAYALRLKYPRYFDLTLSNDETGFDQEVVFSNKLIAENDGNRLPINIDLNFSGSSQKQTITFGQYLSGNTLVSSNYYNPNNESLVCYSGYSSICDAGLTGIDVGLFNTMSGVSLNYTMGIDDTYKFHPHYRDRRFKFVPVTGYTQPPNDVFSGRPKNTLYNIVSKTDPKYGYYQELYGGFYQGFYKLYGYDYEVFPNRVNKGWSVEMVLRPRIVDEYSADTSTEQYLNDVFPQNKNTFFYFGTRAENKFYHYASGSPVSDTGYTRTTEYLDCLETCACSNSAITNSDCISVYPQTGYTIEHDITSCGATTIEVPTTEKDPKFDVLSNSMSLRFDGNPFNPSIAIKYLKITGDCVTTGSCETSGVTFQTGYTINEVTTPPIYSICEYGSYTSTTEQWVMVSCVFERYTNIELCDLENLGGVNDLRTTEGEIISFDQKWFNEVDYRKGLLKIYVNGFLFFVIEDFEEIIPRELNTEKEKQVGVPFNISFGGGTQGLFENLTFSSCTQPNGPYVQDPELFSNQILSATTLSGLSTNILLDKTFGGSFMGGLSQFRMYVEPLTSDKVQHNFRILKDKFELFDYWCPECFPTPPPPTPPPPPVSGVTVFYGKHSGTTITQGDISSFSTLDVQDIALNYLYYPQTFGYLYMLVDQSITQPVEVRNDNNSCEGFIVPFKTLSPITIVDILGNSVIYNVYRTFVPTHTFVDTWVCN